MCKRKTLFVTFKNTISAIEVSAKRKNNRLYALVQQVLKTLKKKIADTYLKCGLINVEFKISIT